MPSPAFLQTSATATPTTPTILLSGRQTLTGAGGGGGTIVVFSNNHATTWTAWNGQYTATMSATAGNAVTVGIVSEASDSTSGTVPDRIWLRWNQEYTTGASATLGAEVTLANATGSATTVSIDPWPAWNHTYARDRQVSDEEFRARQRELEAAERQRLAQYREEQAERQRATDRAALLLRESLSPEQRAELADKQYFTLRKISQDGEERIYRIHKGRSHNIERVDASGRRLQRYCMHPIINCPDEDTMLTQKLWLQDEQLEEELLRRANRS